MRECTMPVRIPEGDPPAGGHRTTLALCDLPRIATLQARVTDLMTDGQWRTLREIQAVTGGSEAGISARLRDMRKPQFGGYEVDRRRRYPLSGVWEYRVLTGQMEIEL